MIVWQKAMRLTAEVYRLTRGFPKEEMYVLTAQVRRAAISVPSNIAEGHARQGREFANYLSIALGSAAEIETQLLLGVEFGYLTPAEIEPVLVLITEVRRMAATIINRLTTPKPPDTCAAHVTNP
ncbi:MAG TPA: four helix bundle protein [Urbifossiella sp.]|nr:four helix bundle protein [Urbifossiella sp.]